MSFCMESDAAYKVRFARKKRNEETPEEFLKSIKQMSQQIKQDAICEFYDVQLKKKKMDQIVPSKSNKHSRLSNKDISVANQHSPSLSPLKHAKSQNNLLNAEYETLFARLSKKKASGKVIKNPVRSLLPSIESQKIRKVDSTINLNDSLGVPGAKIKLKKNFTPKARKIPVLYSQVDTRSPSPEEKSQLNETPKAQVSFLALRKFIDESLIVGSKKTTARDQETGYSKNLLGRPEQDQRSDYTEGLPSYFTLDQGNHEIRNDKRNELIRKLQEVKASKMPSSYNNVSPSFPSFQMGARTPAHHSPVRHTPSSFEYGYGKDFGLNVQAKKSPRKASPSGVSNDASSSPSLKLDSLKLDSSAIVEEYKKKVRAKNTISVVGVSVLNQSEINTSKRVVIRLQPRDKTDRQASSSEELEEEADKIKIQYSKNRGVKRDK